MFKKFDYSTINQSAFIIRKDKVFSSSVVLVDKWMMNAKDESKDYQMMSYR